MRVRMDDCGLLYLALFTLVCFASAASAQAMIFYEADMRLYNHYGAFITNYGQDNAGSGYYVGTQFSRQFKIENKYLGPIQADLNLYGTVPVDVLNISGCTVTYLQQPAIVVSPGQSTTCILGITPTAPSFSFNISIDNDDPFDNPYYCTVSGTAVYAELDVEFAAGTPTPVTDGSTQNLGALAATATPALAYNLKNSGTGNLTFPGTTPITITSPSNCTANVATQPPVMLYPSGSTTITVNVTLGTPGAFSFAVSIANNDANENPYNWTVSGSATGSAEMDVLRASTSIASGSTDALGTQITGAAASFSYEVANSGNHVLSLTGNPAIGFSALNNCTASLTVAPGTAVNAGQSTSFEVSATALADGAFSFTMSIDNTDPNENPYTINASGNAYTPAPEIELSRGGPLASGANDNVGSQTIGTPVTIAYTVSNTGNLPLNLTGSPAVQLSSPVNCVAVVTAQPQAQVPVALNTAFSLSVTVATAAAFSFDLSMANDDPNENPYMLTISGMGANVPEIEVLQNGVAVLSGQSCTLGTQTATVAGSHSFTINNTGLADLNLTGTQLVALSSQANCTATVAAMPASTIGAGASSNFVLTITPTSAGPFTVRVSIASNDGDENPYVFDVGGIGQTIGLGGAVGSNGGGGGGCSAASGAQVLWLALLPLLLGVKLLRRRS